MGDPNFFPPIQPHFFQPLLPGFHNHLNIPVKFFMKHIEGKNEDKTAKLRSNGSYKTWEVKLDGQRFTDGWEEFADDHEFRVGDFVVFRHEGDLVFLVTGFGPSLCNLQYSSSSLNDDINIDEHNIGNVSRRKKVMKNPRTEADSPSSHSCFMAHVTAYNLRVDRLLLPKRFARLNGLNKRCCETVLMSEHGRPWTSNLSYKKSHDETYIRGGWRSFCHANGLEAQGLYMFKLVRNGATPVFQLSTIECGNNCTPDKHSGAQEMNIDPKRHTSKDRSNSGECSMRKAKRKRWRVSSSPWLNRFVTLTITPTILREGWLRLPLSFTRANGINKSGKITLLDNYGVEWPTTLWMERKAGIMSLGRGLRDFLGAIRAKEGESFMLELIWRDTSPLLKFCSKIHSDIESTEHETVARTAHHPEEVQQKKMEADKFPAQKDVQTRKRVRDGGPVLDPALEKRSKHQENGPTNATSARRAAQTSRQTRFFSDSDQMAEAKQKICDALNTPQQLPEVLGNGKQNLVASLHKLDASRSVKKKSETEAEPSEDHSCFVARVTAANLSADKLFLPKGFARSNGLNNRCCEILLMNGQGRSWALNLNDQKSGDRPFITRGWRSFCHLNGQEVDSFFMLKLARKGTKLVLRMSSTKSNCNRLPKMHSEASEKKTASTEPSCQEKSSKRKEKKIPLMQKASSSQCQNRFLRLTLTPQSVKRNSLRLSKVFTKQNGIKKPGEIILVDKDGVEWPVKLLKEDKRGCGQMSLGRGWKEFCKANGVKTNKSFVLELKWEDTTPRLRFCSKVM